MIVDTEKLFHAVNSDLVAVQFALEHGTFPQVREEQREERTRLRGVKDAIAIIERYAQSQAEK